jgi:hypothetical protein
MASKNGLRPGAANARASKLSSAHSGNELLNTPAAHTSKAALAALRKSLARATEPALRERLALAVASLELGRRPS